MLSEHKIDNNLNAVLVFDIYRYHLVLIHDATYASFVFTLNISRHILSYESIFCNHQFQYYDRD